jgi:hypothetical protein
LREFLTRPLSEARAKSKVLKLLLERKLHKIIGRMSNGVWKNGLNEAKERGKEKHQEGGVCRKKKTHNRTLAKICTHGTGQAGLVCG